MSEASSDYKSMLTTSVIVLAISGLLGWLLPLVFDEVPGWLPALGLIAVAAATFTVLLAARRSVKQSARPIDVRSAPTGGGWLFQREAGFGRETETPGARPGPTALFARVAGEIARAGRYGNDLSLIAVTIDGDESDRALVRTVGEIVQNSTRVSDAFGPSGSGGITVILVETDTKGAQRVAEKLRRNVEVFPFGRTRPVTVSLGIAGYRIGDDPTVLISRAEEACRTAGGAGGNQVVIAGSR